MGIVRILLAISIVLGHARGSIFGFKFVNDGQMAVQAFFILSGFYSTYSMLHRGIPKTISKYKQYVSYKYLKMAKPYWIILIVSFIVNLTLYLISGSNTFTSTLIQMISFNSLVPFLTALLANISLLFQQLIFFFTYTLENHVYLTLDFRSHQLMFVNALLVPQAWAIGVELLFYAILPVVLRLKFKHFVILGFISLVPILILIQTKTYYDPWSNRFFLSQLPYFCLGILSCFGYIHIADHIPNQKYLQYGALIVVVLATISYQFPLLLGVRRIAYSICITFVTPLIFHFTRNSSRDIFLSRFAYYIYLTHFLAIVTITAYLPKSEPIITFFVLILTLTLSSGMVYIVDRKPKKYELSN